MKTLLTQLKYPALISFILVIPFMVMELINRQRFGEGFPLPLFAVLWLLPLLFLLILMPLARGARAENRPPTRPAERWVRIALLMLIVVAWIAVLADQMPCFLGVPGCD